MSTNIIHKPTIGVHIMSKEFNRHEVSLCISHSSGDSTKSNDSYFILPLERKKEIFGLM